MIVSEYRNFFALLAIHIFTASSPANHRRITGKSPMNHRRITDESPVNHRRITDGSPLNHRESRFTWKAWVGDRSVVLPLKFYDQARKLLAIYRQYRQFPGSCWEGRSIFSSNGAHSSARAPHITYYTYKTSLMYFISQSVVGYDILALL